MAFPNQQSIISNRHSSIFTVTAHLPQLQRVTRHGNEVILVPVFLEIPVDPLEGFTPEEAPRVALDRLAELPLQVTLGGVLLDVQASIPLFQED
jgi:hypothetical protein